MKKFIPVLILIIACELSTAPEVTYTVEDYFPLAVGNTWIYTEGGELDTVRLTGSFNQDGKQVYRDGLTAPHYYNYDNGKLIHWIYEHPSDTGYYWVEIAEPIEVGHEWQWTAFPMYIDTLQITAIDLTVTVGAGRFENCIKIEIPDENLYWIYAPDVGLIESYRAELTSYEVE